MLTRSSGLHARRMEDKIVPPTHGSAPLPMTVFGLRNRTRSLVRPARKHGIMTYRKFSPIAKPQARDLGYSLRRHFVDDFHLRHIPGISQGSLVLDLGGNRVGKRGIFNIDRYNIHVIYANLSVAKLPHVQADAAALPFPEGLFDAVICSELLEHVPDPVHVVTEIHRVTRRKGTVLICVPFLNRIHGDPEDYGRYTDRYWRRVLERAGFTEISIEKQGLFWSVLVDMIRDVTYSRSHQGVLRKQWVRNLVGATLGAAKSRALQWDGCVHEGDSGILRSFTTGFGIEAIKS